MTNPVTEVEKMSKQRFIRSVRLILLIPLIAVGLLLLAPPALAEESPPVDDGIVVWNDDYTLKADEWVDGDVVVFNGDATLEEGSRVTGSVIVWNGSAEVEGTVGGDLVVSSGDVYLGDSAHVEGNVVCSWNCDLDQEEGARVDGSITEGVPAPGLRFVPPTSPGESPFPLPFPFSYPATSWLSGARGVLNWMLRIMRNVVAILVIATVAGLVGLIWPQPTARIQQTIVEAPGPSLGIGLLTLITGIVLVVALAITLCLAPLALLVALVLGAVSLFGWIGVGALVGERLLQALNAREITPLWSAGLGTLVLTLVSAGLSVAFCLAPLGWLIVFVLGCLGLGAVVLTRLGLSASETPVGVQHMVQVSRLRGRL